MKDDLSVSLPADSSPERGAKADAMSTFLAPLSGELAPEATIPQNCRFG